MHKQNRMMPVFSCWRRGKAVYVFGIGGFQDLFIGECRCMVALIGNDHPVIFYALLNLAFSAERLHHGDLHNTAQGIFSGAQLADNTYLLLSPPFLS